MSNSEIDSERMLEIIRWSDQLDAKNRERGATLLRGLELGTMLIDISDQDETLNEIVHKTRRATGKQVLDIVGVIEPSDETIETWAQVHKDHSLLALDNEVENICERIVDDSLVVILSPHGSQVIDWYQSDRRAEKRRKAYGSIPKEVLARANYASSRGAMRSSAARWVAKIDYDGHLGGGQPQNPLRIGGK